MKKSIPLKEIVGFLPYGLPARLSIQGLFNLDREYPNENDHKLGVLTDFYVCDGKIESAVIKATEKTSYDVEEGDYDIFVRPLSDLTKEVTHNGETFVPIVELFKIAINVNYPNFKVRELKIEDDFYCIVALDNKNQEIVFGFDNKDKSFGIFYENKTYSVFNQLELFDKLHEYLIDFRDWIKDGLAIDMNTI